MIDMTLIKSRFPFNQEKVNSILESITVGKDLVCFLYP